MNEEFPESYHLATRIFIIWKDALEDIPEFKDEIDYFRNLLNNPPKTITHEMFFSEYTYVVFNSGWKQQIAQRFHQQFMKSRDPLILKNHPLKYPALVAANQYSKIWFEKYNMSEDKIEYLRSLPMMGGDALGYHLARNFGHDCVKPDRWLKRLAKKFDFKTPLEMCKRVQADIRNSEKLGVIDLVFWRGANLGFGDRIL